MLPGQYTVDDLLGDEPGIPHSAKNLMGEQLGERFGRESRRAVEVASGVYRGNAPFVACRGRGLERGKFSYLVVALDVTGAEVSFGSAYYLQRWWW